jgi:PAS domain S-box-containing protein
MRHRVREDLPVDAEGRTWSAATTGVALLVGGGLICLLGVVFPFSPSAPEGLIAAFGIVTLLIAGGVWLVRRRIREPALHVLVVAVVVMAAFVVAHARTYAGAMVSSFPYVWIALYVALFFTRRAAFAHAAFIVASLGVALAASGIGNVFTGWLIASTTVVVTVVALSSVSRQLRRQAQDVRAVMTSAAEGIITLTLEGRASFVNPSAARMLGYEPGELSGHGLSGVVVEGEIESGESDVLGDAVFRRKDGTTFPVIYNSTPIRLEEGYSGGIVLTFTDISERREMEQMKDELISVVGHELRTPLTSIRGSLGLMAGGVFGELDEGGRRMLEIAISNTDRLVRLINDILDIERIEAGQVTMRKVRCQADELVAQAVEAMRGQAETAGVRLVGHADDVLLRADVDRIQQTLTNLISNAIKFSSPGGEVRVTAQGLPDAVVFGVTDRGRGVPADKHERIFERFGQVDASDAREKGGTGLGLPIARSIIEQHGGRIWVDSEAGRGATFWFTLPAASALEGNGSGRLDPAAGRPS